ncbi:MAG: hypothetical protein IJD46_03815 [Bacilli bacterium]|nr:hypothetical protein [Bacilli bacterium]
MKRKSNTVKLYGLVIFAIAFLFALIIGKLAFVALSSNVDGINLKEFASNRNTVKKTLYAERGTIYDAKGKELASNVNSYKLIAYLEESRTTDERKPEHVVDKEKTAKELAPILKMEESEILRILNKDAYQVEFGKYGRNLTEHDKSKIDALALPGIDFITSTQRYYKMSDFASYLIGYAKNNDNGEIVGEMGIEKKYNDILKGTDGFTEYQKDAYGYQMPNVPSNTVNPEPGSNIYLTIDNNIQIITEKAVTTLAKKDLEWVTFTVMNAKTGAIVASSSTPSFNPNKVSETLTSYVNPLVAYQYEPGSTMKIFSWLASIEEDIYDGNAMYESGKIEVADATIKDFNNKGWGRINFDTGFAYSSNVAATKLGLTLGVQRLKDFYNKCGFGKKTGIELPGELAGQLNFTYQTELANASFGQGITTTPIQTLQALSLIANDGIMLKPYVVDKIVDANGKTTYQSERTELGRVASSSSVNKMQDLMYDVVYNGLSKYWQPDNVVMIGKTGTAQIASPTGGYLKGNYDYIKSFAGIFPAEEPEYIVYISVKQLIGSTKDIADTVTTAVEEIANYANLTEEKNDVDKSKIINISNYINKKVDISSENIENLKLQPVIIGDGNTVINQYPRQKTTLVAGNKIFLLTNGTTFKMPDIKGWTLAEVISFCNLIGIDYEYDGYGYVKDFNLPIDSEITKSSILKISLEANKIIEKEEKQEESKDEDNN